MSRHEALRWNEWKAKHPTGRVVILPDKGVRSGKAHRYYWAYLTLIEKETGNNANDLHLFFKQTLLPPVFRLVLGKEREFPRSTKTLDKEEFSTYLDKICAEVQIPLPDPEAFNRFIDSAPLKGATYGQA